MIPNPSASEVKITHSTLSSAKIDGGQRIGMEVLSQAVMTSIEKAKISGIAIVGASNYSSATGAIGLWSRKIAESGLIGIVMSQVC